MHWPILTLVLSVHAALTTPPAEKLRGLAWVGGPRVTAREVAPVAMLGANWIAQTPFGWMRAPDSPDVRLATSNRVYWGESDEGLAETHRLARAQGVKTLLKPHLWLHGSWPGAVSMKSGEDWKTWFASYTVFALHYAELAEREGFEMFAVGNELKEASAHESEWRELIARTREVYHGPITYAANWDEADKVPFWDAVDYIGVNAYFPLADEGARVTADSLARAWAPTAARLAALSAGVGRPLIFTEIGYRADPACAVRPWEWSGSSGGESCQAAAYEAMLRVFWTRPWFAGAFVWKWFPDGDHDHGEDRAFSPQGRPGERVLKRWWSSKRVD